MSLASGLRRRRTLRCGLTAGLVLVAAAVPASRVHATTPNLSGQWVTSGDTRSSYILRESKDESVLNASWAGLPPHQTLQGHFSGTLNTSGEEYDGTFKVTEQGPPGSAPVTVSGDATFVLRSSVFAIFGRFPTIDVTLNPTNVSPGGFGGTSTFTLELFAALPQLLVPDGVTEEITNPTDKPANGSAVDQGTPTGGAASVGTGVSAQLARAKPPILGKTLFSIPSHKSKNVTVLLNKQGRALLRKRGSLNVRLVIRMSASSGLPAVTKSGIVTIRK